MVVPSLQHRHFHHHHPHPWGREGACFVKILLQGLACQFMKVEAKDSTRQESWQLQLPKR
jgi:hypothetical protein